MYSLIKRNEAKPQKIILLRLSFFNESRFVEPNCLFVEFFFSPSY